SLRTVGQQVHVEAPSLSAAPQTAACHGLALKAFQRHTIAAAQSFPDQSRTGRRSLPQLGRLAVALAASLKDATRALQLAAAAIKRRPQQRALGIDYAQALQGAGRYDEAQAYLRDRIKQWGEDEPGLYQMLAQSEERNGQPV